MTKKLKLDISDFDQPEFILFGIHSELEGYRMAFFLNKFLKILLEREKNIEIESKDGTMYFECFKYTEDNGCIWHLIPNKNNFTQQNIIGLFDQITTTNYFIPEHKSADYILRIEDSEEILDKTSLYKKINEINSTSLIYNIEQNKLKSNLYNF